MNQTKLGLKTGYPVHSAKPFLKWAGGKTQLIREIEKNLPKDFKTANYTYIEPFIGSGAVLFWLLNNYPKIEKAVINDINSDLMNTYRVISSNPEELISILNEIQMEYYAVENNQELKSEYYYKKRKLYNLRQSDQPHRQLYLFSLTEPALMDYTGLIKTMSLMFL